MTGRLPIEIAQPVAQHAVGKADLAAKSLKRGTAPALARIEGVGLALAYPLAMKPARATMVPNFDVEQFAKEAVKLTVVPPYFDVLQLAAEAAVLTIVPPSGANAKWTMLSERSVPVWSVLPSEIAGEPIDHRAAFILLHVDGVSQISQIVATSGIVREEVLSVIAHLVERGFMWLLDEVVEEHAPVSGIRELASSQFPEVSLEAIGANW